jgi:general nucleoside transport system ATP-binding protein
MPRADQPAGPGAATLLLDMQAVTKTYGTVTACDQVDFAVERGEIHGLLGENGAGKSTLMKLLVGLVPFESGKITFDEARASFRDPRHAARAGIAMVQQHFSLVTQLRVWENVGLALEGRLSRAEALNRTRDVGERYGLAVDPEAIVDGLSVGQRQRVELIKCLARGPKLLILDEPTAVLTRDESRAMFALMREVIKDGQMSVVLISHKLDEILDSTDRVTVMRDGKVVDQLATADATAPVLARRMVGREVVLNSERAILGLQHRKATERGATLESGEGMNAEQGTRQPTRGPRHDTGQPPALSIRDLHVPGAPGQHGLKALSMEVRRGSIVGMAGVDGNGQVTFERVMMGLIGPTSGSVVVDGRPVEVGRRGSMKDAGVRIIPEDRHSTGCVLDMSVTENLLLTDLDSYRSWRWFVNDRGLEQEATRRISDFRIICRTPKAPMRSLSGGNQQRVVIAREFSSRPSVLIASQPFRGIDVAGVEYITEKLQQAAKAGVGIVLISSDLEEILAVADRIVVIYEGRLMGELEVGEFDAERLGLMMGGHPA